METDYWHASDYKSPLRSINPRSIGISTAVNKKALDQVRARIWEGASNVEIGFMGREKGSLGQGGTTPEMHTKEEREEVRQLAKINEVDLSTHTTVALGGMSGFEQGNFRPESKETAVNEIKRTVDFAADTAGGGPVVVHTGEFPRPIAEVERKGEKPVFEAFPGEEEKAPEYLVDEKTGRVVSELRRDVEIAIPEWKKDTKGNYVDEEDKIIPEEEVFDKRIPVMDKKTGRVITKPQGWDYFKEEAQKWNAVHPPEKKLTPGQWAWREQKEAEIKRLKFNEAYDLNFLDQAKDQLKNLEEAHEGLEDAEHLAKTAETERDKEAAKLAKQGIVEKYRMPIDALEGEAYERRTDFLKAEVKHFKEGAAGAAQAITQAEIEKKRVKPIEEYGVEQSADALARSAIYAYDKEKTMKLKKPLFVAPENVFPETYGAHPQELKNLILKAREKMTEKLKKERDITQAQAKKIADDHIKATYDVGHANTWKKFFVKKTGETAEETDKRFKKWMGDQVEKLTKEGIIGHVHVSDNFGYYDEHLEPGGGNVPLKELAEKLKKHGYKGKFIAEWGAQPEAQSFKVMTGAWKTLMSPVYKIDTMGTSWTDIESSYFGRTSAPSYLVGDVAPSKDWTLWSETQLE